MCTLEFQQDSGSKIGERVLLEVPANKTSGPYTKPVRRALGESIEEWQQVRPKAKPIPDERSGELVDCLFMYRGRPVGKYIINRTIIPMLCKKAGVPERDARGSITSHRARSTIATQLYNAKQPMSIFALKEWLGHRRLESTQWYAKVTPDKLTEAYLDARYFERNIAVVQVLLDRAAVENGGASNGETLQIRSPRTRLLRKSVLGAVRLSHGVSALRVLRTE